MAMNSANKPRATRGNGLLENFLSAKRAEAAIKALKGLEPGRILDIGCGSYPLLLSKIDFREKFGLDRTAVSNPGGSITIKGHDLEASQELPFPEQYFNAVTALAVFEHLTDTQARRVVRGAYRVLAPGGRLVVTVPHARADRVLRFFSRLGLVSKEELDEHKQLYDQEILTRQLAGAGFNKASIKNSAFEFGFNILAIANR